MIFSPAINTATYGVPREDSGVASALVNTMQQVGGSIGISILSTIAASATASYLTAHHTGARAPAIASTHGYTLVFTISAALLGLGTILTLLIVPSRRRPPEEPRRAPTAAAPGPRTVAPPELQAELKAIPVALICCPPVTRAQTPDLQAR